MKIEKIPVIYHKNYSGAASSPEIKPRGVQYPAITQLSGCEVPFCAIHGVKPVKNLLDKKMQLLQKIESMLDERRSYSHDNVFKEVQKKRSSEMHKMVNRLFKEEYSKSDLASELQGNPLAVLNKVQNLSVSFIYRHLEDILPLVQKMADETVQIVQKRADADTTNYELLSRLHSTLIGDDLNLTAAYKKYYEKLKGMKKLSEVHKVYPRITLPPSPGNIAGQKIVKTFPRDFFIKYDEFMQNGAKDEAKQLFDSAFEGIMKEIAKDSKVDTEFLRIKLYKGTRRAFLTNYYNLKKTHGFASYPEQRKIKKPIISQADIDLLSIDYDKFVLHVLKEQYLEGKNISQIVYTEGKRTIKAGSLPQEYKFEKPDMKIKGLLKLSEDIRREETDYERFNNEQFRSRLKHFFNHDFANSEVLLDRLIAFDAAKFTEGDRVPLIKFLRVLDDLSDNKISLEEAEQIVQKENLRPLGTDSINAAEREKNFQLIKEEQKKITEFNKYCKKYDNAIDSLFGANLEEAATLCISYKPKNADESREISDKIIKLVTDSLSDGEIAEPAKLDKTIKNMYKFYHNKEYYPDSPYMESAIKYATSPDGVLDEAKAGQYLNCCDLVEKYPSSSGYFSNEDKMVFMSIMQKSPDKEAAVLNLIKFDNYKMLNDSERLQISTILKTFDANSDLEKDIVESIIKNIYIKYPTTVKTAMNKEGTVFTDSVMTTEAKEAIIADKPYPACIKYFDAFEKSLARVGMSKEEDGIQVIGSNNKKLRKLYKQEVKIPMEERLYSSNGNFVFDIYKPGLHKLKNTKA